MGDRFIVARRTDLACEAHELTKSTSGLDKIDGVTAIQQEKSGFTVTKVTIENDAGARAVGKSVGEYITVDIGAFLRREEDAFANAVTTVAAELRGLTHIGKDSCVLVVGLGNDCITPDAIGPLTVKNIMVTRHAKQQLPEYFGSFRSVAALRVGVLGTTGIESSELVCSAVESIKPELVIAVDALASRRLDRLCSTVQLSNSGIIPGSGIGNSRGALNEATLGVPVIAVGVPTVVDAATLTADLIEECGIEPPDKLGELSGVIVTPKEIDQRVSDISKLIGYAVNVSLHDGITIEDVDMFLS